MRPMAAMESRLSLRWSGMEWRVPAIRSTFFCGAAAVAGKRRDASDVIDVASVWERAGSQSRPHRFLM